MLREFAADLRFGVRTLRRSPWFTSVAVLTLAVAIGANSAVFSFIDALLVKTLEVEKPGELVSLGPGASGTTGTSTNPQTDHFSYPQFEALRELEVFSRIAASPTFSVGVTVGESASPDDIQRARCALVSGDYFAMIGLRPLAGRFIDPADDDVRSGGSRVVVVSEQYWRRRLGAEQEVLGTTISL